MSIYEKMQEKLYHACDSGNLKIVRHLLDNPNFKKHIDLTNNFFYALRSACDNRHEELIDYLIGHMETKDVKEAMNKVFGQACYRAQMDKIHFLFNLPKYQHYLDKNYKEGWFFRTAYANNHPEVLEFLLVEMQWPEHDSNTKVSMRNERSQLSDFTLELFRRRALAEKLDNSLQDKSLNPMRKKI